MSSVKLFIKIIICSSFYHQNYHYHHISRRTSIARHAYIALYRPPEASVWKLFASTENARYYLGHSSTLLVEVVRFVCWFEVTIRELFDICLFVKNNLKTYQVFDRLIGHQPIATAPALGARAPIEEHVLLTRVAVVVAVHQRWLLPYPHQILYQTLYIKHIQLPSQNKDPAIV